ncbi:hypothetical protein ANN_08552 [Periplaneta americana]|uniref:Uncharacterized protein n=1 Tax=Periplaneta americana TaxID=6978 RepID=A0ABQ8T1S7_PERAM|nr:hypothetical protein ANN_08552 [Periplaneta americana]
MIMSRDQNIVRNGNIKIGDLSFGEVEKLKYLGATVTNINDTREEVKRRINMGNAYYYSVEKILSSSLLSKNLEVRIYKTVILPVVLYGSETWTLTLREEQRLRVFENKVLRKIFGAKRDEVTGQWRKLHNAELPALYSSPYTIITNIKSRHLRWAEHVARMGETRNANSVCSRQLKPVSREVIMDCEKLISEVQKRRSLWDMKNKEYSNRNKTAEVWEEIAKELGSTKATTKTEHEEGVSFHVFPNREKLLQRFKTWVKKINRKGFTLSKSTVVCSSHFRETDFEESSLLKRRLMKDNRTRMKIKKTSVPFLIFERRIFPRLF